MGLLEFNSRKRLRLTKGGPGSVKGVNTSVQGRNLEEHPLYYVAHDIGSKTSLHLCSLLKIKKFPLLVWLILTHPWELSSNISDKWAPLF